MVIFSSVVVVVVVVVFVVVNVDVVNNPPPCRTPAAQNRQSLSHTGGAAVASIVWRSTTKLTFGGSA